MQNVALHNSPQLRAGLLLLALVCALAVPFQVRMVAHLDPDVYSDLYSPWSGTRAALHHVDPYSSAVTAQIQSDIYGHVLAPTDPRDPEAFVYPPWIALPLAPTTLLPWSTVEFVFAILTPIAILVGAWAWLQLGGPGFDRSTSIAVYVLILASWPAVWGCYERQPSVFVIAAVAFSALFFCRGWEIAAGILLALATVKPQLVVLLVLWFLLIATRHRRRRFLGAFSVSIIALVGASAILFPGSIPDWIHAATAYTHAAGKVSLLTHLFGLRMGLLADLILAAALCLRLWTFGVPLPQSPRFAQTVALVLAVTTCLIPANPWLVFNNLLLLPGLFLLFRSVRSARFPEFLRVLAGIALFLALLVVPVCAAIGLRKGYRLELVMLPFLVNYLLPLPFVAAVLFAPIPAEARV